MLQWEDLAASLIACYICRVALGLFGISIKETQRGNGHVSNKIILWMLILSICQLYHVTKLCLHAFHINYEHHYGNTVFWLQRPRFKWQISLKQLLAQSKRFVQILQTSIEARLWRASLLWCVGTGASATVVRWQCFRKCLIPEFYLLQWPTL